LAVPFGDVRIHLDQLDSPLSCLIVAVTVVVLGAPPIRKTAEHTWLGCLRR
jgi:hypothetical protein